MELNQVISVRATKETNVYSVRVNITDADDDTYDVDYISRPDDPYGLNPKVVKWLKDNAGQYQVQPYQAPTKTEMRLAMPPISKRQLSLALVRNGYSLLVINTTIATMPAGQARDEAEIEWSAATTFTRLNPTLLAIAAILGISDTKLDAMWAQALTI